jgi:type IV fimbrial biogenesis protein FimT
MHRRHLFQTPIRSRAPARETHDRGRRGGAGTADSPAVHAAGQNGFTLIELVVTLTVASILAMVAVPSYRQFVESGRLTAATNDLVGDLSYARVEAMKRGAGIDQPAPCARAAGSEGQVIVCASSDSSTCATAPTTWKAGWIVYWNYDGLGGNYNAANCDAMLKIHDALPSNISAVTDTGTDILKFNRIGAITTPITYLKLTSANISANQDRVICLSGGTGRAMVANDNKVSSCP